MTGDWILASEGQSCTAGCQAWGRTCDAVRLQEVTSEAMILAAAAAASMTCNSTKSWGYQSNPGICTNNLCCGDSDGDGIGDCVGRFVGKDDGSIDIVGEADGCEDG